MPEIVTQCFIGYYNNAVIEHIHEVLPSSFDKLLELFQSNYIDVYDIKVTL